MYILYSLLIIGEEYISNYAKSIGYSVVFMNKKIVNKGLGIILKLLNKNYTKSAGYIIALEQDLV